MNQLFADTIEIISRIPSDILSNILTILLVIYAARQVYHANKNHKETIRLQREMQSKEMHDRKFREFTESALRLNHAIGELVVFCKNPGQISSDDFANEKLVVLGTKFLDTQVIAQRFNLCSADVGSSLDTQSQKCLLAMCELNQEWLNRLGDMDQTGYHWAVAKWRFSQGTKIDTEWRKPFNSDLLKFLALQNPDRSII